MTVSNAIAKIQAQIKDDIDEFTQAVQDQRFLINELKGYDSKDSRAELDRLESELERHKENLEGFLDQSSKDIIGAIIEYQEYLIPYNLGVIRDLQKL